MLTYSNAYAEIDLGALADNYKKISEYASPAEVIAVVKADAYGHGVERCSHTLYNCGCRFFAVATANEALEMRRLFSDCEILILGNCPNVELANILCDNDIIITLGSLEYAQRLSQELSRGKKLKCHIKLDTGMNRIGFSAHDEDFHELLEVFGYDNLKIEGMFSHFACSDMPDSPMTDEQLAVYKKIESKLAAKGHTFKARHISNSAATIYRHDACLDYVRCGIIMFGLDPSCDTPAKGLRPVMSLKTHITHVHKLYARESVGYGATFTADKDMMIATIPIGYADGFIRAYANGGYMTVDGKRCPIVGRICMDQCMIDVTGVNANPGDEVEIFGDHTSVDVFAEAAGTINYECICLLSQRVERVYVKKGKAGNARGQ